MKTLIILIIIALFIFIFIQSGTLETNKVTKNKSATGVLISETHSREFSFHWDRFIKYIQNIPGKLGI